MRAKETQTVLWFEFGDITLEPIQDLTVTVKLAKHLQRANSSYPITNHTDHNNQNAQFSMKTRTITVIGLR